MASIAKFVAIWSGSVRLLGLDSAIDILAAGTRTWLTFHVGKTSRDELSAQEEL